MKDIESTFIKQKLVTRIFRNIIVCELSRHSLENRK
uniref:Uncharacterized protein n=1 Tax=Setaria italica TaxID=4555 RepID=K3XU21_SETIT